MEGIKKALDRILSTVCIALFGFLVLLVTWQVVTRFVFNDPSVFSEVLAQFCFVWLVLFGSAFVFGEKGHMAVEIVKEKFPEKLKVGIEILIEVLNMTFVVLVLLIGGYIGAALAWTQMSASLHIPVGYLYLAMPISALFTIFYGVYNIHLIVKERKYLGHV